MNFLFALVILSSVIIFITCTIPGFLHVTGIHKTKNISFICIGLGVIFGINLLIRLTRSLNCNNRLPQYNKRNNKRNTIL